MCRLGCSSSVASTLTVHVTLNDLPFGLRLQHVQIGPQELTITASAQNIAVPVPADASQTPGQ